MVGCQSRCPECRRKCTSSHRAEDGFGRGLSAVGAVWIDETMHAHMGHWNRRTAFPIHAWRVLPRRKGEVTARPRIKKRTLNVRVTAGHGLLSRNEDEREAGGQG